jgi:hypothetical protein
MAAMFGKIVRIQRIERRETITGNSRIRIEGRMTLNEMKIWTTLV